MCIQEKNIDAGKAFDGAAIKRAAEITTSTEPEELKCVYDGVEVSKRFSQMSDLLQVPYTPSTESKIAKDMSLGMSAGLLLLSKPGIVEIPSESLTKKSRMCFSNFVYNWEEIIAQSIDVSDVVGRWNAL